MGMYEFTSYVSAFCRPTIADFTMNKRSRNLNKLRFLASAKGAPVTVKATSKSKGRHCMVGGKVAGGGGGGGGGGGDSSGNNSSDIAVSSSNSSREDGGDKWSWFEELRRIVGDCTNQRSAPDALGSNTGTTAPQAKRLKTGTGRAGARVFSPTPGSSSSMNGIPVLAHLLVYSKYTHTHPRA